MLSGFDDLESSTPEKESAVNYTKAGICFSSLVQNLYCWRKFQTLAVIETLISSLFMGVA